MTRMHVLTFSMATALLAAACSSAPNPAPSVPVASSSASTGTAPVAVAPPKKSDTLTPTSSSVHIDDKILKACGDLPIAHFAFDSSAVEDSAAATLDALARCFSTGPLKGRSMKLIGHTDPRGETEYNLGLGQRRAGSVAAYLASHGVDKARMAPSSHGEFDATGTDEQGWARDRKVDVLLVE